jgi:uncharacterized membrane protein YkvI
MDDKNSVRNKWIRLILLCFIPANLGINLSTIIFNEKFNIPYFIGVNLGILMVFLVLYFDHIIEKLENLK